MIALLGYAGIVLMLGSLVGFMVLCVRAPLREDLAAAEEELDALERPYADWMAEPIESPLPDADEDRHQAELYR